MDDYLRANREHWDEVVGHHRAGEFYDVAGFKAGARRLDKLVLEAVGDVHGRSLLHLQCHFGLDTLDLARLGARVTGLDFSAAAVEAARELAAELGLEARFVHAEVADAPRVLGRTFELVFTSYGVLVWLPELRPWARAIADCLEPGGRFVLIDAHPTALIFDDDNVEDGLRPRYPYFDDKPARFEQDGTYAVGEVGLRHRVTYEWTHPLGGIVMSLLEAGLQLTRLDEYPFTSWRMFPHLERGEDGFWRLPGRSAEIPLLLRLEAVKPCVP